MQTPSFDHSEVHDPTLPEDAQVMTDVMVTASQISDVLPRVALGRARGLEATALMVAVNAQHRMAPSARAATGGISATSIHRSLLAVSRANS